MNAMKMQNRWIPAIPTGRQAFARMTIILALLFLYTGKGICQTAPSVDDPRIEVRWLNQAAADEDWVPAFAGMTEGIGTNALNVVILADGYVESEKESFFAFVKKQSDFFIRSLPYRNRFNVFAVYLPSKESGVDDVAKGITVDTALDSHFEGNGGNRQIYFRKDFVPYMERILQRKTRKETLQLSASTTALGCEIMQPAIM